MNTMDLIELAVLDALGMLEPGEAEQFEAAFRAAPPATQERVRAEQSRLADLERLLPNVAPSAHLRERVLLAVREAVLAAAVARASEIDDDSDLLRLRPTRGVTSIWRVAAIASAAACVAFGVAFGTMVNRYNELDNQIKSNIDSQVQLQAFGADAMDIFFNPDAVKAVRFVPKDPGNEMLVTLHYLDEKRLGLLQCGYFPIGASTRYELVVMKNGQIDSVIQQFKAEGMLTAQRLTDFIIHDGMQLALVSIDAVTNKKSILFEATITL
ncbi:MAG: hypothetical protein KIT54_08440 [Phycisphaeraceae bacterium]|nr:hypothetical protein [Phycisphaeraceae bacterium]